MDVFRIFYMFEHPHDAELDYATTSDVRAENEGAAIEEFRIDHPNEKIECVLVV